MTGYTVLAGFLIFFVFFIYITWFGYSVKTENEKEEGSDIKLNPYDQLPLPVSYTHLTLPTNREV